MNNGALHEDKDRYVRLLKRKIMMTKDILHFQLLMGKYDTMIMMVTPLIVTLHKSRKSYANHHHL